MVSASSDEEDYDSSSNDEAVDWDANVIQPIPPYMCSVYEGMSERFEYSDVRFHGDFVCMRWQIEEDEREVCLYAPDEKEVQENEDFAGKYWLPYELFGRDIRQYSPTWTIRIELGADRANLDAGLDFFVEFESFPSEAFSEKLVDAKYTVRTLEEWNEFSSKVLDDLEKLSRQIDDEVDFAESPMDED